MKGILMARILIVDDELSARLLLQATLPLLGYEVAGVAADGSEGIVLARFLKPDLVLMDTVMPGVMDGIEAAMKIRSELAIPVISLTGHGKDEFVNRVKGADPFAFLIKPCGKNELKAAIETALHRRSLEGQIIINALQTGRREKQSQDRIASTDQKLQSLFDAIRETLLLMSVNGTVELINRRGAERLGRKPEEMMGKSIYDFIPSKTHELQRTKVDEVARTGQSVQFEDTREGMRLLHSLYPVKTESGKVEKIAVFAIDISTHREEEEAFLTNAERYRLMVETTAEGVWLVDREWKTSFVNSRMEQILGYRPGEMLGRHLLEFLDEEGVLSARQYIARREDGLLESHEFKFLRQDGTEVWTLISANPLLDKAGAFNGALAMVADITERKRAEISLLESEERLRLAQKATNDVIWDWDIGKDSQRWNESGAVVFGWSDIVGSPQTAAWWTDRVHPEDRERVEAGFFAVVNNPGVDRWRDEYRFRKADGDYAEVIDRGYVMRDDQGNAVRMIGAMLDITERKRSEDALRKSESRFKLLSKTAARLLEVGDPLSIVNELGREVMAELDCQVFFNFVAEEPAGKLRLNAYAGVLDEEARNIEYLEYGVAVCGSVARDGVPCVAENISSTFDPHTDLVKSYGIQAYACHPLLIAGNVIGTLSFGTKTRARFSPHDLDLMKTVTNQIAIAVEHMRLVELCRKSEECYRTVADFTYDWEYWVGPDKAFLYCSPACERITGYRSEDFVKNPALLSAIIHPDDRYRFLLHEEADEVRDSERQQLDFRIVSRSGDIRWISHACQGLRSPDGAYLGCRASNRDITDRKQAEEALQESEKRYRMFFDHSPLGIMHFDADGIIMDLNDKFLRILGSSRQALLGFDMLGSVPDPAMLQAVKDALDGRLGYFEGDYLPVTSGKLTPVRAIYQGITDEDGNIVGGVGLFEDMTEQRRAEEERKRLETHLRQAQKMEAIGTLAGGIAHDFNNVLSAIFGFTEMSFGKAPAGSSLHADLQQVLEAAERARDLVKQILTFSRRSEQEIKAVLFVPLLKEALRFLRSSIPSTIAIRQLIRVPPETTVLSDPTQIHQVIMNLCTNASYAMRQHGGTLEVDLSEVVLSEPDDLLSIQGLAPGRYLCLRVSDTGCGMDEETIQRIFDPFFTTKPREEGTGMGLAVVYGIVEACGGAITVRSKPGKGSHFHLYFPTAPSLISKRLPDQEEVPRGKGRILFVDDEATLVRMGQQMLQGLGYTIVAETSSQKALAIFQSQPDQFDLLITDYTMPQMNGLELVEEVRRIRADMPVILCSGFTDFLDRMGVSDSGIQELIHKPLRRRVLAEAINRILVQK